MGEEQFLSTKDAIYELAQLGIPITPCTLYTWIKDHDLGTQPGGYRGRIYIDRKKWDVFLNQYIKRKV